MTDLQTAEIATAMSHAAYKLHPSPRTKRVHYRNLGRVCTLRTQAAQLARITKAANSGGTNRKKV